MIVSECLHNPLCLCIQKVKDSWRVVNHRDIIPTVPRLMGYCHVAQPVYLAAGDLKIALVSYSFSISYGGQLSTIMKPTLGYKIS